MKSSKHVNRNNRNNNADSRLAVKLLRWLGAIVFFVAVFLIAFVGLTPSRKVYNVGEVAEENIIAPKRIVDSARTEALRLQAENTTAPVYDYIPSAREETLAAADAFWAGVQELYPEYIDEEAAENTNSLYGVTLSAGQYIYIVSLSDSALESLRQSAASVINSVYDDGDIKAGEMDAAKTRAGEYIAKSELTAEEKEIAAGIIGSLLLPNMLLNESATELARQSARDSVYEVVYEAGQTIINKGQIFTAEDIVLLKKNGLMKTDLFEYMSASLGIPALVAILMVLFAGYMKQFRRDMFEDSKTMFVIALLTLIVLGICQVSAYFSVYLIPVSIFTMSICLMYKAELAVQFNLFFILILAVTLQLDVDALVYLAVSSYVGIIYLRQVRSRSDIFKSGVLVSMVNIAVVLIINVLRSNLSLNTFKDIIYAFGSGILASLLTNGLMLAWEGVFNIVTPFKLLEMSGTNDVVIQKLIAEAPGTYNHSLIVSNLAESACDRIGADSLLARVGSYYHDIGKAEKAIYFKENQTDGDNPHDYVTPEASAKIIKNHVSDGVYLAEKHRIPREIVDFISTHHGTSEITFFKVKAEQEGYSGDEDFHYNGILPSTRETTVVMLADSVEAAVRSLDKPDEKSIKAMIEKIVKKKLAEGQMLESRLSFEELEQVKAVFAEVLCGVYHSRIKYPEEPEAASQ